MRYLLYIGTYERDYPRNAMTIAALRRAGYRVDELHRPIWSAESDKLHSLRPLGAARLAFRLAGSYVQLAVALARRIRQADAVVVGYIGQADMLALAPIARLAGVPVIFNPLVTLTDTLVEDRKLARPGSLAARLVALVDRLALGLATLTLTDTAENARYVVERFGLTPYRTRVVPVGADESVFFPAHRPEDHQPDTAGPLRVLFYGTMIPLHGADTIVRAAGLLGDEVSMRVIGRGQTLAAVRALANDLRLTNIAFSDRVPYAELPRLIAASDVVLGIFGDTAKAARVVPNKIYQAMAMGAAIVTRDGPAIREVLGDGRSALLVPPADPAALAAALRRLRDPGLRSALGREARSAFQAHYGAEALAADLRQAVEHVVAVAPARRAPVRLSGGRE